uniref:Uncharacterized protein n=1 Tax=Arundo donax TaxID=35708 RepID=A0A0A8YYP6_ARUDO
MQSQHKKPTPDNCDHQE